MPLRTRSGRAERVEMEKILKGGPANTSGLPALPTELLLNIVSLLRCIPVPCERSFRQSGTMEHMERSKTLQSLSQSCRSLRSFALPVLWQKIEVDVEIHEGRDKGYPKRLATELVRQLEVVTIRDPTMARYVREVTVCLDVYGQNTIFPELVRALCKFPNMHSLQILSPAQRIGGELSKAFRGHILPSVKLLVLYDSIHDLIKSFPQVREYRTFYSEWSCSPWDDILQNCEGITKVQGLFLPPGGYFLEKVAAKLHQLKYLEIYGYDLVQKSNRIIDSIPTLELLQRLEVLKLVVQHRVTSEQYAMAKKNIQYLLVKIRSLLRVPSNKVVVVEFRAGGRTGVGLPFGAAFEEVYQIWDKGALSQCERQ